MPATAKPKIEEPTVSVQIDIPPFAEDITINNVHYQYGKTYEVPQSVAASLKDMMARAWEHEDQTKGEGRHVIGIQNRRPSNRRIRGF